jgi:hypothetical protein
MWKDPFTDLFPGKFPNPVTSSLTDYSILTEIGAIKPVKPAVYPFTGHGPTVWKITSVCNVVFLVCGKK